MLQGHFSSLLTSKGIDCSRLLYHTLPVKRFVLGSDLDSKIDVHSLRVKDHPSQRSLKDMKPTATSKHRPLERSLKDMKPTAATAELQASTFRSLPVCPEWPPALGQLT